MCALLGCALLWVQADPSLDMIEHLLSPEDDISAPASAQAPCTCTQGGSSTANNKLGAPVASFSKNTKGKVNSTAKAVHEKAESAKKAVVDSAKGAANDILNLSLANATSINLNHVTSTYLSFNKMPLVQQTLSVASCVLFVLTIGLVLKTWKPFHDAPKTMALPSFLQAVVATPGIFSAAGLVSVASPLTYGVCAVAIMVQLRGMLSNWCACISIVGGTVTEATSSLISATEATPHAGALPESDTDMEKQAAGADGLKD